MVGLSDQTHIIGQSLTMDLNSNYGTIRQKLRFGQTDIQQIKRSDKKRFGNSDNQFEKSDQVRLMDNRSLIVNWMDSIGFAVSWVYGPWTSKSLRQTL